MWVPIIERQESIINYIVAIYFLIIKRIFYKERFCAKVIYENSEMRDVCEDLFLGGVFIIYYD